MACRLACSLALVIIPYFGVVTGLCIAILTALANSLPQIQIILSLAFAVVHGIEAMYLTPKIIGAKVGLNPLLTLIALIIGGHIAGFWGLICSPCDRPTVSWHCWYHDTVH